MNVADRARLHALLGDPHRLRIVDELLLGDRTFQELAAIAGLPGNATAHHLALLEAAGLIDRHQSEGDGRRRYVTLHRDRLDGLTPSAAIPAQAVLFICTHNSARSQFAAALWRARTGRVADSAGTHPADRVHRKAVQAAAEFGLDIADAVPKAYDAIDVGPDLVISVCDRAREAGLPFSARHIHWSIPDPVRVGTQAAFRAAFANVAARIDALVNSSPN